MKFRCKDKRSKLKAKSTIESFWVIRFNKPKRNV